MKIFTDIKRYQDDVNREIDHRLDAVKDEIIVAKAYLNKLQKEHIRLTGRRL